MIDAVPLAHLLRLPVLAQARLVAGAAGQNRPVRAVNVMEVPDILDWVRPDELLLTTAYPLRDDPAALGDLVDRLADRGLAGIAVKPARYIDSIPERMLQAADARGFPVIELPPDASFNEIIQAILTIILNAQAARLARTAEIHDRFTRIALSGGGLRQIAEALAELVDRPVTIVGTSGQVQWQTAADAPDPGEAERAIVQPIQVGGDHYGVILVGAAPADLAPDALEAVEYAATVAALRQVQARAVAEADRRFQAVCLEELVTGHMTDRAVLMERATAFAWNLAVPRAVLLAEVEAIAGRPFTSLAGTPEEAALRFRLGEAARAALGPAAITWERSREIAALVVAASTTALRDAGSALQAEARRRLPGVVIGVGIGRAAADPLELHISYAEARRAIAIGRWSRGPGHTTPFEDLGLDRLIAAVPASELAAYRTALIGPLEAHDAARGTNLAETLETYLASRNAAQAARELYLHYNTLRNRLARIEELIGPYLDDPDRCLSLALALRLRRLPAG